MIEEMLTPLIPERFIQDGKYRNGHIRIIRPLPGVDILGLHIPEMKALARQLVKDGKGRQTIDLLSSHKEELHIHEERMIWGMLLNRLPLSLNERLEAFRVFIPEIDNWAVCDTFCSDALWFRRKKEEMQEEVWNFLTPYFQAHREFEVRFALVFSLANFLDAAHIDWIFEVIGQLSYGEIQSDYGESPYYVYMAVAWLMATALYKFPEKTRAFAHSGKCPEHIVRLYVRKARESFRTRNMPAL